MITIRLYIWCYNDCQQELNKPKIIWTAGKDKTTAVICTFGQKDLFLNSHAHSEFKTSWDNKIIFEER